MPRVLAMEQGETYAQAARCKRCGVVLMEREDRRHGGRRQEYCGVRCRVAALRERRRRVYETALIWGFIIVGLILMAVARGHTEMRCTGGVFHEGAVIINNSLCVDRGYGHPKLGGDGSAIFRVSGGCDSGKGERVEIRHVNFDGPFTLVLPACR